MFSRPEEWSKWIRKFKRFPIASGLASQEDDVQMNTLIYAMGDQADDVVCSFALSDVERRKYDTVKEKFDGYFIRRRNVIYERAKFNRRKQVEGRQSKRLSRLSTHWLSSVDLVIYTMRLSATKS